MFPRRMGALKGSQNISSAAGRPEFSRRPLLVARSVAPRVENRRANSCAAFGNAIGCGESGLTAVVPADKWRDGQLVLRPANPSLQEKTWPIETFFHKVVMLRNRLRTLEQQVNGSDLPEDQKVKLQSYITGCYGALTSFNVLFAEEDDQFRGAGGR